MTIIVKFIEMSAMLTDNHWILLIGLGVTCVIGTMTALKLLRNNKVLVFLFIISFLMAIASFLISIRESSFNRPNQSDVFYSPLVYLIIYNTFRYLYLKMYGIEPTYNRGSWYDYEDGRRQNWFDVLVYVLPLFISLGFPILLSVLKR